jgi:hypothetical protein
MDFKLILTVAIAIGLAVVITEFKRSTWQTAQLIRKIAEELENIHTFLQRASASRSPYEAVPTDTLPLLVQPTDTKWEYLIASTKWHSEQWRFGIFLNGSLDEPLSASMHGDSVYDHILSSLGARGWELISVVPSDNKDECWAFVFKRPRTHSSSIREQDAQFLERCKRQESILPG